MTRHCPLPDPGPSKFVPAFDTVLQCEGVEIIHTPYRAPDANAVAERWIRSVRPECLDHLLIISEAHLRRVLDVYVGCYNEAPRIKGWTSARQSPHHRPLTLVRSGVTAGWAACCAATTERRRRADSGSRRLFRTLRGELRLAS